MAFTNSPLVSYTKISPNQSGQRKYPITRISIHCVVGQCSVETLGSIFAPASREASSNYGIGYDGKVGMYVEEKDRSWCTSSADNDNRAITIEVASDTTHPYAVRDAAYQTLLNLVTDICKRNGKKKVVWFGDKAKTLAYTPAADEMVLTVHRWFANKSCPGDYLYNLHPQIAAEVTKRLGGSDSGTTPDTGKASGDALQLGDKGDAVKTMQTMLIACGYSCGSAGADGDFGSETLKAVKAFQTDNGLDADGVYGPITKAALEKKHSGNGTAALEAGTKLTLNGVKIYKSSATAEASGTKTGTFYVWSKDQIKGRIRITNAESRVGVNGQVTGWIDVADAQVAASGTTAPAAPSTFTPYLVRVNTAVLNVRKGPATSYAITTQIRKNEVYTIVAEENGWGKLKSGAGWIYLGYTVKR